MSTLTRLTTTETRLFFREPMSVFFALAFPSILFVILGLVPAFREHHADLGGLRVIDLYAPILVATGITMFALTGLPQQFATYREKGVLRRMRTTPVTPRVMLAAQLLMSTALSVVSVLLVLAVARLGFDVRLPEAPLAYVVAFVLCALAMFAVGLLVASLAPNGKSAGSTGTVLLFPLLFFAGLWIPRDSMNDVLRGVSDATPLGAGVQSLQDAAAGHWPQPLHVVVLLAWTVAAGALAARYFRWE
ncbi:ABC transporter permease [Jiangella alba]|uniref:Transport permease protein n=1 Tax=Jiangella alba TaxID=561176 RepID=A0A1H5LP66_9ACTN|nr:ABC transporter permease [Jiangella alba]SEE77988.1 ABC-2 type transport system permease protein [Jiangella alba]